MIKSVAISSGSTGELPAGQELPSYQVLTALVVSLRGELARAQQRIAELEDKLRKTSRNSSRPPSGDGLAKPPPRPRSPRKKSGRRPGGQHGHPGSALVQVAEPGREERHEPACCQRCGAALAGRLPRWNAARSSTCRR
jgi:transposase